MEETITDKILANKDTVRNVRKLAIGVLLGLSIPFGVGAIVGMGAFCIALNSGVFAVEKKLRERQLVNFYKDEIGSFLNKSPDRVTIDDMRKIAEPPEKGGKGIAVLQHELKDQKRYQKFRAAYSVISSLLTAGTLVAIALAVPAFTSSAMGMVLGLGLTGLGYHLIANSVRGLGKMIFGQHEIEGTVSQRLIRISHDIKKTPVEATEIFGLLADTRPQLQDEIRQKYGKNYADLPIIQKEQVAEDYEAQYRMIGLTEAINNGLIRPSMAGFILSHQLDPALPDYYDYKSLFDKPLATIPNHTPEQQGQTRHAERLLSERSGAGPIQSLH